MHLQLKVIGISHKTACMGQRELFDLELDKFINNLEASLVCGSVEYVKFSTCNRSEVILGSLDESVDLDNLIPEVLKQQGSYLLDHLVAVRHFFKLCAGLESLVLGEAQILGQVKEAYRLAISANTVGAVLHKLFQESFRVAKKLRSETNIGRGSLSVASIAVAQAERIYGDLKDRKALIVGAGETGTLASKILRQHNIKELFICNRTFSKSEKLSSEVGGIPVPLSNYRSILGLVDIVVLAIKLDKPNILIDKQILLSIGERLEYSPFCILDLSVPRVVDKDIEELDDFFSYSVDDLQPLVEENLKVRQLEASRADSIIDIEIENIFAWFSNRTEAIVISDIGKSILQDERLYNFMQLPSSEYRHAINKSLNHFFKKIRSSQGFKLKSNRDAIKNQIIEYLRLHV